MTVYLLSNWSLVLFGQDTCKLLQQSENLNFLKNVTLLLTHLTLQLRDII